MYCTCRDNQDVDQPMIDLAGTLWILERGKVLDRLFYRHCHSPLIDEGRAGMAHQSLRLGTAALRRRRKGGRPKGEMR
jgi:hypothetical protein